MDEYYDQNDNKINFNDYSFKDGNNIEYFNEHGTRIALVNADGYLITIDTKKQKIDYVDKDGNPVIIYDKYGKEIEFNESFVNKLARLFTGIWEAVASIFSRKKPKEQEGEEQCAESAGQEEKDGKDEKISKETQQPDMSELMQKLSQKQGQQQPKIPPKFSNNDEQDMLTKMQNPDTLQKSNPSIQAQDVPDSKKNHQHKLTQQRNKNGMYPKL